MFLMITMGICIFLNVYFLTLFIQIHVYVHCLNQVLQLCYSFVFVKIVIFRGFSERMLCDCFLSNQIIKANLKASMPPPGSLDPAYTGFYTNSYNML